MKYLITEHTGRAKKEPPKEFLYFLQIYRAYAIFYALITCSIR